MLAFFHFAGTTPRDNDILNKLHRLGAMAAAMDFKSRPGMLSGPQALFGPRLTRTASTSATDRWISDKS